MALNDSDRRSGRKVIFWIIGGFAGLGLLAVLIGKPGQQSPVDVALIEACRQRYSQAHSRGDSILADAWIPRPDLQVGRGLRRCGDLPASRRKAAA